MEKKMTTLVCHGDSLTEGGELDGGSIGPSLIEARSNIQVINSGGKTVELLNALQSSR